MNKIQPLDYAITLQRAIEYHCNGKEIPEDIAKKCPYHAEKLNKDLRATLENKSETPASPVGRENVKE